MVIQKNNQKFVQIQEAKTILIVPESSVTGAVPSKSPAFFNRLAKLNRDISVLAYRAFALRRSDSGSMPSIGNDLKNDDFRDNDVITFADALSGTGARALRVAVEAPEIAEIYVNDINRLAVNKSKLSAKINHVVDKCHFSSKDVHRFLVEHKTKEDKRFTIADLDPFGSPTPYIDSLLRSVKSGGLISVTATDTAVLAGVYPEVCLRKYFGMPLNNSFSNETGIRLLLSLISLEAARFELIAEPVFVHANLHYLRVYFTIERSSDKANTMHKSIGFIKYCFKCRDRKNIPFNPVANHFGVSMERCGNCRDRYYTVGGPLWIGRLFDKAFVRIMNDINSATTSNAVTAALSHRKHSETKLQTHHEVDRVSHSQRNKGTDPIQKALEIASTELDSIPYYFRSDEISSSLRKNPMPIVSIIEKLVSNGFSASRTILNPGAFKTDAQLSEVVGVLK